MRTRLFRTLALLTSTGVIMSACGMSASNQAGGGSSTTALTQTGDTTTTSSPEPVPNTEPVPTTEAIPATQDPVVSQALASMGDWLVATQTSTDSRPLFDDSWTDGKVTTMCTIGDPFTIGKDFNELAAFPFEGPLQPGLIVEGAGVVNGDLRVIPLDRSPIQLVSSLDSENNTVVVDNATSGSLQEAVTSLKRDADTRLGSINVTPALIEFNQHEVHSFEEASLELGLSLNYQGAGLSAKFKSSFNQESRKEKHSIVVSLVQEMFTVRAASDRITSPGDYFAPSVDQDQINQLISDGRLGGGNTPILIDSVTYGRVVYVTITSSTVADSTEIKAAIEASYGALSGAADVDSKHTKVLEESDIRVLAFGGTDETALAAIRSGKLSDFFTSVPTSTAIPINLTMRTLTGDRVMLRDEATVKKMDCNSVQDPYVFQIELSSLNGYVTVYVNDQKFVYREQGQDYLLTIPQNMLRPGINTIETSAADWFPCVGNHLGVAIVVDGAYSAPSINVGSCVLYSQKWTIDTNNGAVEIQN